MKEKIRIASGQGFWGDLLDAPVRQVRGGQIDYLMLDYLAEVTMSILQKQRAQENRFRKIIAELERSKRLQEIIKDPEKKAAFLSILESIGEELGTAE